MRTLSLASDMVPQPYPALAQSNPIKLATKREAARQGGFSRVGGALSPKQNRPRHDAEAKE
jgi:hypothetical protein